MICVGPTVFRKAQTGSQFHEGENSLPKNTKIEETKDIEPSDKRELKYL